MLKQYTETVIYIYIKFAVDADFQTDSVQRVFDFLLKEMLPKKTFQK